MSLITSIAIFFLAAFVGFFVISRVPNTLHTPLMSATNAIHGIVLLGAVIVIGAVSAGFTLFLAITGIVFGTINIVGGFLVTDRMLQMFQARRSPGRRERAGEDRDVIRVGG
jgi:proton-translocating NAD(P)+ transhydrogenase subunit alpha